MAARGALVEVKVLGIDEALTLVENYRRAASAAEAEGVLIGTNLPYAYGIHEGRHRRSRRLARRAGGAEYLTRGLATVESRIGPTVAAALPRGPAATIRALQRLAQDVLSAARRLTPVGRVRGGSLRRSLHTELARRR